MAESRLKIARKKKYLTQKEAAKILGITPQAWSSAELGKSKLHRSNLEKVAKEFDVSFSWLVTGEGNDNISLPENISDGKFVRVVGAEELITGKKGAEVQHVFITGLDQEAVGYTTRSERPPGVDESTLIVIESGFKDNFENGKLYLMAIDGMLIVRKIEKILFGANKGTFKLSDHKGETDFIKTKGITLFKVLYQVDKFS
ncbi:MAG: transcriptional regulator with XRE-family HTH domain [Flavobacteriales bacterium]|jgi:transcriptional regulator with XRE-family HTH domain